MKDIEGQNDFEKWKSVTGYEGLYEVSSLGRVKSLDKIITDKNGRSYRLKERILSPTFDAYGYLLVTLYKNTKRRTYKVHRLVANEFVINDNPEEKNCVNHLDEDKTNNHADNLQWVTIQENLEYGSGRLRQAESHKGWHPSEEQLESLRKTHKHCRLPDYAKEKAWEINKKKIICIETGEIYDSLSTAAKMLGVKIASICDVLHGRIMTCRGLHFKYLNERK